MAWPKETWEELNFSSWIHEIRRGKKSIYTEGQCWHRSKGVQTSCEKIPAGHHTRRRLGAKSVHTSKMEFDQQWEGSCDLIAYDGRKMDLMTQEAPSQTYILLVRGQPQWVEWTCNSRPCVRFWWIFWVLPRTAGKVHFQSRYTSEATTVLYKTLPRYSFLHHLKIINSALLKSTQILKKIKFKTKLMTSEPGNIDSYKIWFPTEAGERDSSPQH